ncbi:hypothetical protein AAG906_018074 [Vitis piasezkii]
MHPPKFINSRAVQSICRHLDCEHRKYTDSGSAKAETSIKGFRKSCSIGDPETYIRFGKSDLVSLATATRLLDFWTNSFLVGTGTDYFCLFYPKLWKLHRQHPWRTLQDPPVSFQFLFLIQIGQQKLFVLPSKFLSPSDEHHHLVNPKFQDREQHDQLIMSWILASISDALLTYMVNCDTSAQLHNTKKGDLSISDYLLKIRNIVDHLVLVGHNLSTIGDHIDAVFERLPQEYETFIISVNSRIDPYIVEEIETLLLAQETRIEKNIKIHEFSAPNLAHLVTFNVPLNFNQRSDNRIYNMNSFAFSRNGIYHNRGNSSQRGRGRSVMQCYYRFDQSFSGLSQLQGNRPQGFISNLYPFA